MFQPTVSSIAPAGGDQPHQSSTKSSRIATIFVANATKTLNGFLTQEMQSLKNVFIFVNKVYILSRIEETASCHGVSMKSITSMKSTASTLTTRRTLSANSCAEKAL